MAMYETKMKSRNWASAIRFDNLYFRTAPESMSEQTRRRHDLKRVFIQPTADYDFAIVKRILLYEDEDRRLFLGHADAHIDRDRVRSRGIGRTSKEEEMATERAKQCEVCGAERFTAAALEDCSSQDGQHSFERESQKGGCDDGQE